MTVWLIIIFVMGLLLSFAPDFVEANNCTRLVGIVITLICVGLGIRTLGLRRKGDKEKLAQRVRELEGGSSGQKETGEVPEKKESGQ